MLLVSKLIIAAAQARQESRGTHLRTDFPDTDPPRPAINRCTVVDASPCERSRAGDRRACEGGRSAAFHRLRPIGIGRRLCFPRIAILW